MDDTIGSRDSPPSPPAPQAVTVPLMVTLNDTMAETSTSADVPRPKRTRERYEEYYAKAQRTSLEARKRHIEQLRSGKLDPIFNAVHASRKQVRRREESDKLYALFKCDREHHTCMRCYEHHSKKCRYCFTTEGSVVKWKKEKAKEYTNQYSCHKGRSWVIPKEDDFFCPDSSCQFCGPLDSVLNHNTDVHSMTIQHLSYGEVIRIPLHLVSKYVVLRAEDGATFVLSVDDTRGDKILSYVCAEQPSFFRSKFTLELAYDLHPVVRSWLRGQHWTPLYYATNPRIKPWNIFGNSIIKYEKNHNVAGIAHADSQIIRSRISSSNLGDMHADNKNYAICVPQIYYDSYCGPKMWYGDLILSISSPSDAMKSSPNV